MARQPAGYSDAQSKPRMNGIANAARQSR